MILHMTQADIPQVLAIEQRVFSDAWTEDGFQDSLANHHAILLVAKDGDEVQGYCCLYTVLDEGEIVNVAVKPEARRRSIAMEMVGTLLVEGAAKGVGRFFLEVRQSNIGAQKLYEKLGFSYIGIRKNFYEKPAEDALLMFKAY